MGDGRRDGREEGERLLVDPGVGADDEIRLEGLDALVLEPVLRRQDLGFGVAELVLGPGPGGVGLVAVPVGDADGLHAQGQDRVLLGHPDRDDAGGLGLDHRGAQGVLDGDRERLGGRRGRRRRRVRHRRRAGRVGVVGATRDHRPGERDGEGEGGHGAGE